MISFDNIAKENTIEHNADLLKMPDHLYRR